MAKTIFADLISKLDFLDNIFSAKEFVLDNLWQNWIFLATQHGSKVFIPIDEIVMETKDRHCGHYLITRHSSSLPNTIGH